MKHLASWSLLLPVLTACLSAPDREAASLDAPDALALRVDSLFSDIRPDAPGCAVGVYQNGAVVLARGYGMASLEDRRPITPSTTFDLGSGAKQFTALAVLMLESRGRWSLADDVRQYVPGLPEYGTPIRIRDLLQHTSGLRDYGTLGELAGHEPATMPDLLALLTRQQRLNFMPGTRHEYSHSDFELLSVVIEQVTGEPFGTFLEREVLAPLGMTGSRVHDARGASVPERAFGHERAGDGFRRLFPVSQVTGGSNLYTSIEDLAHWDRALDEGARGERPLVGRLLTRPTLPDGDTIPYAYGIRLEQYRGLPTVARGGHVPGMMSELLRFLDHGYTVVTLCNGEHLYAGQRAHRVADLLLGDQMEPQRAPAAVPAPVPVSVEELRRYAGFYRSPGMDDLVRIVIVDGRLAELLGDTLQTFTHVGGGVFFGDGSPGDFRLAFSADSAGGAMRFEYLSEGEVTGTAERMPDAEVWRPDATALAEYADAFASVELDAVWQLAVRDGLLVLRRPGRADAPLTPIRRDLFTRHFGAWNDPVIASVAFLRDAAGQITQFSVTTPPGADVVRDLRFVRLPPP